MLAVPTDVTRGGHGGTCGADVGRDRPKPEDYLGALPPMLRSGSLVFSPSTHPVSPTVCSGGRTGPGKCERWRCGMHSLLTASMKTGHHRMRHELVITNSTERQSRAAFDHCLETK